MIEGRTRGDISRANRCCANEPELVRELLERIARATAAYLKLQIAAGAAVVQLFDTWAGELTTAEYDAFELPATQMVVQRVGSRRNVRKFYSPRVRQHLRKRRRKSGANVISVDWRTDLADARRILGPQIALQGNVDPSILLGREDARREAARDSRGEDRRRGTHSEFGPRHPAHHSRCECAEPSSRRDRRAGCSAGTAQASVSGLTAMSDATAHNRESSISAQISDDDSRKIQSARAALHQLSHRAGMEGRFRPGRSGILLRASRRRSAPRFRSTCIFPSARTCACSAPATYPSRKIKASRFRISMR